MPTLILHGDDDQIVPIGAAAMLSSKIVKGSTRYQGKRVACIAIEAPDDIDQAMPTLDQEVL